MFTRAFNNIIGKLGDLLTRAITLSVTEKQQTFPLWSSNYLNYKFFQIALKNNLKDFAINTTALFGYLSGTSKWIGGVLAPNGKIYCVPYDSTQVLEIDPITNTTALFGSLSGTNKWHGGVLAPNGKIYCVPYNSTQVLEIGGSTNSLLLNYVLSRYLNKF